MRKQILPLDPTTYQRHLIHGADRIWVETNCYVDVWVELLHAMGFEPIAALPFTLGIDFEGDQWTFFKFISADIYDLYGLDIQELAIWRPLAHHLEEQLTLGRPVLVELDSYYLPDTAGSAYQRAHVKTTVAVNEIDIAAKRLGYFHSQAYFQLQGLDFAHLFRLGVPEDAAVLPPYVEFVKRSEIVPPRGADLLAASLQIFRRQLRRLPRANPFAKFKSRLETDLSWLMNENMEMFHQYSFATLRQFGASFELAATYLQWLRQHNVNELDQPIATFQELSTAAKTMQFQLARTMTRKKPLDLAMLDSMADKWQIVLNGLQSSFL
jgi:Domain of unknown function (DUF1839)